MVEYFVKRLSFTAVILILGSFLTSYFLPENWIIPDTVITLFLLILNLCYQAYDLTVYRRSVIELKKYYVTNGLILIIIFIFNITFAALNFEPINTYCFFLFKVFFYFGLTSKVVSVLIVDALFLIEMLIIPIFVKNELPINPNSDELNINV